MPVTGQGQWALGHLEPLNANERTKKDDDGLNVRARIENIYSKAGFASIDGSDLRGRMRWYGLYTQRRSGIPGGLTATLEPEELDDEYFMMRVRIDGGAMTADQLRTVAGISTDFGRDLADITDRQNVQFHWIRIEDVPEIWKRLEAVGLSSMEACGDTPRVILGCPLAGYAADEVIDGTAAIRQIIERYIGSPEFSNLPRKFKTAVSGCADHCTVLEINDVSFVGVVGPDDTPGFDLWVGGGLSTNPKLGVRLGAFVTEEQVPEVWKGVVSIFRDYGYRRSRTRARIKFLVADWGAEKFREVLEREYLGYVLPDSPPPAPVRSGTRDHIGVTPLVDGTSAVGFAPRVGRVSGTTLRAVADLADRYGNGQVRATTGQKMVILGVTDVESLTAALAELDLQARPSAFRRGTMACTGLEFCKLAIVETKARSSWLIDEMERRMPDFAEPVGIHVNGCPNACARFQVADIGLKGMLIGGEEGFQVHLGGSLAEEAALARKVRGLKVTAERLPDLVEHLLRTFEAQRAGGETFASWVRRADESLLSIAA